jgi:peptidoglycan/xylan/chitin deacetylase (PgdA/CDA1 family)
MNTKLMIIWDYDSALGQINSSYPYNFNYYPIYEEIKNVDYILTKAKESNIKMTFACLGFDAEDGIFPFNNPEQIKKIFDYGHEIASHSWKHESFQYLTGKQIYKSLERSKYILEKCLGSVDIVKGFVPPHSRPMSWYKKLSFSLGDRAIYPIHKGGDIGYILRQLSLLNYKWCRVLKLYKPFWKKIYSHSNDEEYVFGKWEIHDDIVCVPQHYTGFDETAQKYLEKAILKNKDLVIVGHPAALSREGAESLNNFTKFMDEINKYRSNGQLEIITVNDYIAKNILYFDKK